MIAHTHKTTIYFSSTPRRKKVEKKPGAYLDLRLLAGWVTSVSSPSLSANLLFLASPHLCGATATHTHTHIHRNHLLSIKKSSRSFSIRCSSNFGATKSSVDTVSYMSTAGNLMLDYRRRMLYLHSSRAYDANTSPFCKRSIVSCVGR